MIFNFYKIILYWVFIMSVVCECTYNTMRNKQWKQMLCPLCAYAYPIWSKYAQILLNKLQIFQNKILRVITIVSWFIRNSNIHKDFKIPRFQNHIRNVAGSFYKFIHKSTGSMFHHLNVGPPQQRRLRRGLPHDLIV